MKKKENKIYSVGKPSFTLSEDRGNSELLRKLGIYAVGIITAGTLYLGGRNISDARDEISTKNLNLTYQGYTFDESKKILIFDEEDPYQRGKIGIKGPQKTIECPEDIDPDTLKSGQKYDLKIDSEGDITSMTKN